MNLLVAVKGTEPESFYRRLVSLVAIDRVGAIIVVHVIDVRPRDALDIGRRRLLERRPVSGDRARDLARVEEERAMHVLRDAIVALEESGAPRDRIRSISPQGKPNEVLRDLAECESAVLVVGGRDEQGPHSIGKTARFLIDHAPIAAILVRCSGVGKG